MIIPLPENVQNIINELYDHGYAAYAVGGCVRDVLIGKKPGDWDITTSATPPQIKAIFKRTVDTGIAHGTVTVLMGKETYEVTTFRVDGEYKDARHPEKVIFVPNLSEDLLRRDFTINAMAYNDREGLIDLYGGIDDLKSGVIRCVGEAEARFTEDALRMMRAVRFSAQLGFDVEKKTAEAITLLKANILRVSAERIQAELVKLVMSEHPERWEIARETGLAEIILPELEKTPLPAESASRKVISKPDASARCQPQNGVNKSGTLSGCERHAEKTGNSLIYAKETCSTMVRLPKDKGIRLAAMFRSLSREEAAGIMRRLKFDNATYHTVITLIGLRDEKIPLDETGIRWVLNRVGDDLFLGSLKIKEAYEKGCISEQIDSARKMYETIRSRGDCTDMKSLAINGADLKAMGIMTGPVIGELLKQALSAVIEDPERNDRDYLLNMVSLLATG